MAIEHDSPEQVPVPVTPLDPMDKTLQKLAMKSYLEARQRADLQRDIAACLLPTEGPFRPGDRDVGTKQGFSPKKEPSVLLTLVRQFCELTSQNCGRKSLRAT